jgi:hypothetical protein
MPETTSAYLDDAGRPRLRPSIVAFFDILLFAHRDISYYDRRLTTYTRQIAAIDDSRDLFVNPLGILKMQTAGQLSFQ